MFIGDVYVTPAGAQKLYVAIALGAGVVMLGIIVYVIVKLVGGTTKLVDRRTGPVARRVTVAPTSTQPSAQTARPPAGTPPRRPALERSSGPIREAADATVLRAILPTAAQFTPRFADISPKQDSRDKHAFDGLNIAWSMSTWFPLPNEGEVVLGRYHGWVTGTIVFDGRDNSPASSTENARGMIAFEGLSSILVTDLRIAGVCTKGEGLLGEVASPHWIVVWTFARSLIDNVAVGEDRVTVINRTHSPGSLKIVNPTEADTEARVSGREFAGTLRS